MLTLKLLYLWPPDTELCGPFDLTHTSVLGLFCEVNWSHSKPESWLVLTRGQQGRRRCYLVLSIDAGPRTSGSWGEVVNTVEISPCGCWALSVIQVECTGTVSTVPRVSVWFYQVNKVQDFQIMSIYCKQDGSQCLLKDVCFYGGRKLKSERIISGTTTENIGCYNFSFSQNKQKKNCKQKTCFM